MSFTSTNLEHDYTIDDGFTLIEVIVYLLLFSTLVVGLFGSFFIIIQGQKHVASRIILENEGIYVLHKIMWGMDNADTLTFIPGSTPSFSVSKRLFSANPIVYSARSSNFYIAVGSETPVALFTNNISVSNMVIVPISDYGGNQGVRISFSLRHDRYSENFESSFYIHL